jgi:hypothetical protein
LFSKCSAKNYQHLFPGCQPSGKIPTKSNQHKRVCQDLPQAADVRYWEIYDLTFELIFSTLTRRPFRIPPFKQKCDPRPDQNECPNPIGVNAEQSLSRKQEHDAADQK